MAVVATDVLVGFGTLVVVLSVLGLFTMRDAVDRLHYAGPVATLTPLAIALAIVIEDGFTSQAGLKSIVVALAIAATSPIVTYATLRAIQTRRLGRPEAPSAPGVTAVIMQSALYALVIFGAAITVFTPDPKKQIFAFSFYSLTLGLLFLALQAPDVALSEIVVGSAAVPLVVLVTLSRMRERR